mgnify:CR=1 FL=1
MYSSLKLGYRPEFSFLFPFETRRLYLNSTSFGVARALKNLKITIHGQPLQVPRLHHNKVLSLSLFLSWHNRTGLI